MVVGERSKTEGPVENGSQPDARQVIGCGASATIRLSSTGNPSLQPLTQSIEIKARVNAPQ
jgi:hypothetical protein